MSIRYRLNYWEAMRGHWLLQAHYLHVSPFTNYPLVGLVALIFVLAPLGMAVWAFSEHANFEIILFGVVPLLIVIVFLIAGVGIAALFRFSCLLEIDPEGLRARSFLHVVRKPWSAIIRLEKDSEYLYFGSEISEGALFLMIPIRSFESRDAAETFFDQAMTYRKQAGAGPVDMETQPEGSWPPAPKEQDKR